MQKAIKAAQPLLAFLNLWLLERKISRFLKASSNFFPYVKVEMLKRMTGQIVYKILHKAIYEIT